MIYRPFFVIIVCLLLLYLKPKSYYMKKILLVLCAVITVFTACKKTTEAPPVETLKGISLGRDTLTMRVGQTVQLTITTTPEGHNQEVSLSSSDTTVVTVKNDGKLTAKKNGTAVITATNQLKTISLTCLVTVADIPDPLKGVLFTDTLKVYSGDVIQLNYTTTPPNYDPNLLVWKSSDSTVVSVSNTGKVTAKEEGVAIVTLTNKAKTFSLSGIISVSDLKKDLLAFYPFNNDANDASGNGNNGVASYVTSIANRFGEANSAYYFNGYSSIIAVKDNPALRLANTSFTLNAWVKLDQYNYSYGSQVVDKKLPGENNGWNFSITGQSFYSSGQGSLGVLTLTEGSDRYRNFSVAPLPVSQWHMATIVFDYTLRKVSFYIDGIFNNDGMGFVPPNSNITAPMYIGADNPNAGTDGYFLKGAIDDLRIYGRALSARDIKKLYNLKN